MSLFNKDKFFGLYIPETCPGVPDEMLNPQKTWGDQEGYARQAGRLIEQFEANFKQYTAKVSSEYWRFSPHHK